MPERENEEPPPPPPPREAMHGCTHAQTLTHAGAAVPGGRGRQPGGQGQRTAAEMSAEPCPEPEPEPKAEAGSLAYTAP